MWNEAATRSQHIDKQLSRAEWSIGSRRVASEYLVESAPVLREAEEANSSMRFDSFVIRHSSFVIGNTLPLPVFQLGASYSFC